MRSGSLRAQESLEASALQLRAECKNHKASSESASERLGAAELRYQRLEDDNERLHEVRVMSWAVSPPPHCLTNQTVVFSRHDAM